MFRATVAFVVTFCIHCDEAFPQNGSIGFLQPRILPNTTRPRALGGVANTWYRICNDDDCSTAIDRPDTVPTDVVGNNCDTMKWITLYDYPWSDDGFHIEKINMQTDFSGLEVKLLFFGGDYCTGPFEERVAKYNPGFNNEVWEDAWQGAFDFQVKSIRTFVEVTDFTANPGVGIKLIVFPRYDMYPYDEFSCLPDTCNDLNDDCNVLQGARSPEGGPSGDCASPDDWIFCIPPGATDGGAVSMIWPSLDFSDANDGYVQSFVDYPLGSIFFGVYHSNWGADQSTYCGALDSGDPCANSEYTSCNIVVRFWKGDSWPSDQTGPDWDDINAGVLEYKVSFSDACNGGNGAFQNLNTMQWWAGPDWSVPGTDYGDNWPGWMSWVQVGLQDC